MKNSIYLFEVTKNRSIKKNVKVINRSIINAKMLNAEFDMLCPDYDGIDLNLIEIDDFKVWFRKIMDRCPLLLEEFVKRFRAEDLDHCLMGDAIAMVCCACMDSAVLEYTDTHILVYVADRYIGSIARYPSQRH